jgi:glutamate/tyrosine decarboxylase-like PLP-dependent enzyme
MSSLDFVTKNLAWLPKPIAGFIEKRMKSIPAVQKMIDSENDKMADTLEKSLKPYKEVYARHHALPKSGIPKEEVLKVVKEMSEKESSRWQQGYVSGGIYHGAQEHIDFVNEVYALHSQSNPLHGDLFPSATKYEAEIVSMTAHLHGQGKTPDKAEIVGTVTSGGTESILCAMKAYRDKAREERGVTAPEMILATTAHVAFEKAAQYFGIKMVKIDIDEDFKMKVVGIENAITKNTICIIASAPSFPHGIIDPIDQIAAIAEKNNIGMHTDCCLGGFVLPFAEKLGYPVPKVDFRIKGVTSMSVDTHKYGFASKGTSVVLYRSNELRQYQYYATTDWPGGLYMSPTLAGSRPGGLSAACWATMLSVGENGYMNAVDAVFKTADTLKNGIKNIPELKIMGEPFWIIALQSDVLNIYEVLDQMTKKHWNLNGLHKPACVHIALTLRHTMPGVAERFLSDLQESVEYVKQHPGEKDGFAPVYGMASSMPFRGLVSDFLKKYLDVVYKV